MQADLPKRSRSSWVVVFIVLWTTCHTTIVSADTLNTITKIVVLPSAPTRDRYPRVSYAEQRKARSVFNAIARKYKMELSDLGGAEDVVGRCYTYETKFGSGPQIFSPPLLPSGVAIVGIAHGRQPNLKIEAMIREDIITNLRSLFGGHRVRVDVLPAGIAF